MYDHNFKWMIRATWWSMNISMVHPFFQCPRQLSPTSLLTPPIPTPSLLSVNGFLSCLSGSRSHQKRLHTCTIIYTGLLVSELINSIILCITVEQSALKSKIISSTYALDFLSFSSQGHHSSKFPFSWNPALLIHSHQQWMCCKIKFFHPLVPHLYNFSCALYRNLYL